MPLTKQFIKSKPEVKVTFAVAKEAAADAKQVMVLGEFTQWQPVELKRMKNGEFKVTLNLPTNGAECLEFCYQFINAEGESRYDNDWSADGYVPGPYGRDNSIVRVNH